MVATETGEVLLQVLRSRRSMARVKPDRPPRALVEKVIQAAVWAPNHYRTEPWRFIVLTGKARQELGDIIANALRAHLADVDSPESRARIDKERNKPLRAPVVIAVAVMPSDNPRAIEIEDIAATAAGVENMLLAAEALGLGAMWRTGNPAYDPTVKRFLGLPESAHLLSFVYLGYPDLLELPERHREARQYTTWRGWD